jgi:flagellar hook-basal body complex protein FliE
MPLPIGAIAPTPITTPAARPSGAGAAESGGFSESLSQLINSVDSSSSDANKKVGQMLEGTGEVHDAMIALQRAELTLQLTVQVRNKLVQAYQDIMRMPI